MFHKDLVTQSSFWSSLAGLRLSLCRCLVPFLRTQQLWTLFSSASFVIKPLFIGFMLPLPIFRIKSLLLTKSLCSVAGSLILKGMRTDVCSLLLPAPKTFSTFHKGTPISLDSLVKPGSKQGLLLALLNLRPLAFKQLWPLKKG